MPLPQWLRPKTVAADFLREIDRFFEERGEVHQTLKRLVRRLERAHIPYAIVGGMAVNAHGHERMTKDVDVLLSRQGFEQFRQLFVPKFYQPLPDLQRRFVDRKNGRGVDVLVAGLFPGNGQPGPAVFPAPDEAAERIKKIQYIGFDALIRLKLAARRYQDLADVVKLIEVHGLDESYLERLHPSLRGDFVECLEEKRREEQYLRRQREDL